jgi:hypothetical protein
LYAGEGTRHIVGDDISVSFMNDKVCGSAYGNPFWADYRCGTDISGKIDIKGAYQQFAFTYDRKAERMITGTFGPLRIALGKMERIPSGFVYRVFVGEKEHRFSIRYERVEDEHMLNSVIEGGLNAEKRVRLTVKGRLCPFATTGIIMIIAGGAALAG